MRSTPIKYHKSKPAPRTQRGLIGILLLVTIAVMAVAVFSKNIWGEDSKTYQAKVNREALKQAKAALLAYVEIGNGNGNLDDPPTTQMGRLPCPNQDGNGTSPGTCGTTTYNTGAYPGIHSLGLLPWATLGSPVIRDASRQCLWYAVDGAFKIAALTNPINSDSFGSFSVVQPQKSIDPVTGAITWTNQLLAGNLSTTISNSSDRVIAAIIASGSAGGTQAQIAVGGTGYTCGLTQPAGGPPNAEASAPDFLKYYSSVINNQSLLPSTGGAPTANTGNPTVATPVAALRTFITADIGQEQLNDQVAWITAEEFSKAVTKRTARILANYINNYVSTYSKYPPAADTAGGICKTTAGKPLLQGFFPKTCTTATNPIPGTSLTGKAGEDLLYADLDLWLGQVHYAVSPACVASSKSAACINGSTGVSVGGGTASAIILMRGRPMNGQATCSYTVSGGAFSASTIYNCIEGANNAIVSTAVSNSGSSGASYKTTLAGVNYVVPDPSASNDYLIQLNAH